MRGTEEQSKLIDQLEAEIKQLHLEQNENSRQQWRFKRAELAKALYQLFDALQDHEPFIAVQLLYRSAEIGYTQAIDRLYELETKSTFNQTTADVELENGSAETLFFKGLQALCGVGIPRNLSLAFHYFKASADLGSASAQYSLGWMYDNGQGVQQDFTLAMRCYCLAAEQKYASAQYHIGMMYYHGTGVQQDAARAYQWILLSAEQGLPSAQFQLGMLYKNGEGVQKNDALALHWLQYAAEQGNASAQYNLGQMYRLGNGVLKDTACALKYYHLAAEQGKVEAQYYLGIIYEDDKEAVHDFALALKWYLSAAKLGYSYAQINLGSMYFLGKGVLQDVETAIDWFHLAAKLGNNIAQNNLGGVYFNGQGVPKDFMLAAHWFRLGTENKNPDAKKNLELMYQTNKIRLHSDEVIEYRRDLQIRGIKEALIPLRQLATNGDFKACYHLMMHQNSQDAICPEIQSVESNDSKKHGHTVSRSASKESASTTGSSDSIVLNPLEKNPNAFYDELMQDPFLDEATRLPWLQELLQYSGNTTVNFYSPKLNKDNYIGTKMKIATDLYIILCEEAKNYNVRLIDEIQTKVAVNTGKIRALKLKIFSLIGSLKSIPEEHSSYAEAQFILAHLHYILDEKDLVWMQHLNAAVDSDPDKQCFAFSKSEYRSTLETLTQYKCAQNSEEKDQLCTAEIKKISENRYPLFPLLRLSLMTEDRQKRSDHIKSLQAIDQNFTRSKDWLECLKYDKAISKEDFENISGEFKSLSM